MFKKCFLSFMILVFAFSNTIYAKEVILGGHSIALELDYEGVMIVGGYDIQINNKSYNPLNNGLKIGDIIIKVNNQKVTTIQDIASKIYSSNTSITVLRDGKELEKNIQIVCKDDHIITGLLVREKLLGIGTLTYIDDYIYASLGHSLNENIYDLKINKGNLYYSTVTSIVPCIKNKIGEKIAIIHDDPIGSLLLNHEYGVYGKIHTFVEGTSIETAPKSAIKKDKAYLYTVLEGDEIIPIEIEIIDINHTKKKGITLKVIDQDYHKGIVMGMSGSPIVQNGKLIGALSHVSSQNYCIGYGIDIESMLEISDKLK